MAAEQNKRNLVALVTTEVFTPYRAGEVFCLPEEDAERLLTVDKSRNEYGVPRYPKIKVRRFNPAQDGDILLQNHSLNLEDHNRLLNKLHPERPAVVVTAPQYKSEITDLLDEIDPERSKPVVVAEKKVEDTPVVENPPRRGRPARNA